MTTVSDEQLSNVELVVLAALTAPRRDDGTLNAAIASFASPDGDGKLRTASDTVAALQRRALVDHDRKVTANGRRVLAAKCGMGPKQSWAQLRDKRLPALMLGTDTIDAALKNREALALALARQHCAIGDARSLEELADTLLVAQLGLPAGFGPITLERLRAQVIAKKLGGTLSAAQADPVEVVVALTLGTPGHAQPALKQKPARISALGRRWFYDATRPAVTTRSVGMPPPRAAMEPPHPPAGDPLLSLVREAIPRIGSDGRFGAEKVFVSAIWRRIETDHRVPDLSLDRFKRWLVTANRDQLIDLARADLVGAMDAKLVADSEIQDKGATFHFVIDRHTRAAGTDWRPHAR